MARTYGALGPQGTNELIPRPDRMPAPVFFRGTPGPSKGERESYEESQSRRRRERREGTMYREAMKQAMRQSKYAASEQRDANALRDFERVEAMRRAPLERELLGAEASQRRQLPGELERRRGHEEKLAMMEDLRSRDLAELEASTSRANAGAGARGQMIGGLAGSSPYLALALAFEDLGGGGGGFGGLTEPKWYAPTSWIAGDVAGNAQERIRRLLEMHYGKGK